MTNPDPRHIHPRSKRPWPQHMPHKPLFKPLVPMKPGTSRARPAITYRGHPDCVRRKLPTIRVYWANRGKWTPNDLVKIRAIKGV